MTNKILVPYDGSMPAEQALTAAAESFPDAELVVLQVVEPASTFLESPGGAGQHERAIEEAEQTVATAADSLPAERSVETAVVTGRPVHEIVRYAGTNPVDHIVMGSHGRDGATRLLLGSVAETVLRRSPVPVTIVREGAADGEGPDDVLVPFDGSSESRRALSHALAQYPDAAVTAVYVVYPPAEAFEDDDRGWNPGEFAASILEMTAEVAPDADAAVTTDTAEGRPATAIVEYIEDNDVDHVVIGSHGRDGLTRLLLGSVAETVVRRSPTSVTVVR
jgi:nucleotide-binding universal stress UspA family protein